MPGVRHVLQTSSGVAVIADSWWQAKQARDALDIQWSPGPNAKLNNAAIYAGLKAASSAKGKIVRNDGDADAASARRCKAHRRRVRIAHARARNAGAAELHGRVQGGRVSHLRADPGAADGAGAAAQAAGLPIEKVFVHTTFLGGGFGRRLDVDFIPAAVECAKAAGKPVKLLWTREDDTSHDKYRPPARNSCSAALDEQGKISAFKLHLVAPSITVALGTGRGQRHRRSVCGRGCAQLSVRRSQRLHRLSAARDRHRCRLLAFGESRAQLLHGRKLHGRSCRLPRARTLTSFATMP